MSSDQDEYLSRHYSASSIELNKKVDELINLAIPSGTADHKLYKELFLTTIRMVQADRSHWDAKLAKKALEEMEKGFNLSDRFKRRRKVTVFGSARTPADHPLYQQAKILGHSLAENGFMVITGAGGGIMAAAHEGAGRDNSLGFNIKLPFEQSANDTMEGTDSLLTFQYFFIRKLFFVKEAEGLVLCPGGFGTWDEALEVLTLIQTGKTPLVPVILLDTPDSNYWTQTLQLFNDQLKDNNYILPSDMRLMTLVHSPEEATQEIVQFYANYQSSRWFKELFAIRMDRLLTQDAINYLSKEFSDLCIKDSFTQKPYEDSFKEPEFKNLNYLLFYFTGRQHGRLRELIDYINQPENWVNKQ